MHIILSTIPLKRSLLLLLHLLLIIFRSILIRIIFFIDKLLIRTQHIIRLLSQIQLYRPPLILLYPQFPPQRRFLRLFNNVVKFLEIVLILNLFFIRVYRTVSMQYRILHSILLLQLLKYRG